MAFKYYIRFNKREQVYGVYEYDELIAEFDTYESAREYINDLKRYDRERAETF